MKKTFLTTLVFAVSVGGFAQVYQATSSKISFFSEAQLENIEAHNEKTKSLINVASKDIAFVVPIIDFKFEKALMQEHFNETYMETTKYPGAKFKGKIDGDWDLAKDGAYDVSSKGMLNIHGVEKETTLKGTITVKGDKAVLDCKFTVKLADHKIKIPKAVFQNIAEEVDVTVKMTYEAKK